MRALIFASMFAILAYQGPTLYAQGHGLLFGEDDPHLQPAIALRCSDEAAETRALCEHDLRRDFESGERQPEAIVRRHCTRYANGWAEDAAQAPSAVCDELFGGWIEG